MTRAAALLLIVAGSLSGGCAALSNPVADAIPVRRLPEEVLARPRDELQQVPFNLLRQVEPEQYRLDKGDILAVVADEIIAPGTVAAPVRLPDATSPDASTGYPVPVSEDGTISLPLLSRIPVRGKTIKEVERLIIDYATGRIGGVQLVRPGAERITVQLLQKRTYEVVVIREDSTQTSAVGTGGGLGNTIIGTDKKATGQTIRLQAYENDILHALNATGGVPGFAAEEHVTVTRGKYDPNDPFKNSIRIPLRAYPDRPIKIKEEDIILKDGDILFVEARDADVYYTAGLIGSGTFLLPRDNDIRVIEAIARVRGPLINGAFSSNGFVAQSVNSGLGSPSPSLVTVIRKLPGNRQIPIRVDLDRAFRDPRENIIVRSGDLLVMQETPGQSMLRYATQAFRFSTVADTIKSANINQALSASNP